MRKEHVLITVLGSSPAVITETLYALHRKDRFPNKMHVFTTSKGKATLETCSFVEVLSQFCHEYDRDISLLDNINVHVVKDEQGNELDDIRCDQEQILMADMITGVIRNIVATDQDNNVVIDASIAGGRKSMSFYMGYIFSMFARDVDYLSHVLVDSQYEYSDFMYPTKVSKPLHLINGPNKGAPKVGSDGTPLDAVNAHAAIELAEIPFIRLNQTLVSSEDTFVAGGQLSYSQCIEAYQLSMRPEDIRLTVNVKERTVNVNGWDIELPPEHMALYSLMIKDTISGDFMLFRKDWDRVGPDVTTRWITELASMCDYQIVGEPIDELELICEEYADYYGSMISSRTIDMINQKGFTTHLFDRLRKEIIKKLASKMVGNVLEICSPNSVDVNNTEASPFYRKVTKSKVDKRKAAYGICLNPAQISVI